MGAVKKETEKLIQNQFSALQAANQQNVSLNKEPLVTAKEEIKEEVKVNLTVEQNKETSQKDKKSKKKKKAEKKQASIEAEEKNQEVKIEPVKEEVKEEKKNEVNTNKKESSDKSVNKVPETNVSADTKNKSKAQEKQDKKEDKNSKNKPEVQKIEEPKVNAEIKAVEEQIEVKEATKSKKKKKKKNKAQENNDGASKEPENAQGKTKKEDHKGAENDGSTDEEDAVGQNKTEAQFSKSKKKKLKKKAKQQALFECIRNAEMKIKEMKTKHFTETMAAPYYASFLNKFRQLLAQQNDQGFEGQGMFMREYSEEKGPFGDTRIKLQVSMKDDPADETVRKDKKRRNNLERSELDDIFEITNDLYPMRKTFGGEIEEIQIQGSDILDPKEVKNLSL